MAKVFDWSEVPAPVTRAMLVAAYTARGQHEEAERCQVMVPAAAAAQAGVTLGRPPKKALATVLVDPLREVWVPTLSRAALQSLVVTLKLEVTGPAAHWEPRTKEDLRYWITVRNRTETFCLLLLREFTRFYKTDNGRTKSATRPRAKSPSGPIPLVGAAAPLAVTPHPYQREAWRQLDDLAATSILKKSSTPHRAGGLVVIPTGGGKTLTAVSWLTALVQAHPQIRVLWLADRQELVDQAARAFVRQSPTMPVGTTRTLRVIHGNGSPATLLAKGDAEVICATRQSVIGKSFTAKTKANLSKWLTHPTVIVVDEAHHAVAPTYRKLLDHIEKNAPAVLMVGLTATPWPAGAGMTARLHERFPTPVVNVDPGALIATQVLARPVVHSLATDEDIWLNEAEFKAVTTGDLPASVLRKFDRYSRNRLIVDTWTQDKSRWGKTLVFACDIAHAETLGQLFTEAGVKTAVVHSGSHAPADALKAFRTAKAPRVLISVDMLREGVDIPDARTAILARPTRSPIVLRQMIGRVLRGPLAGGGEPIAHIVDLRDKWRDDVEILSPLDVPDIEPDDQPEGEHPEPRLPRIIDDRSQRRLPVDVVRSILKQYDEAHRRLPHPAALHTTRLVGYYQLAERNVPVFEHALDRWDTIVRGVLHGTGPRSPLEHFDDLPVPRPSRNDVAAVVNFTRSYLVPPPLVEMTASLSPQAVAEDLLARPAETQAERDRWLRDQYETTLAAFAYPDYSSFREAVLGHADAILRGPSGLNAEAPPTPTHKRKSLTRARSRPIKPLFDSAVATGRELLADDHPNYLALLDKDYLPAIQWTQRPVSSTLAYWAPRISGQKKGTPIIRVNSALHGIKRQVPDEVLRYLIWHELCHHVLPGRGHDHEFRRLEGLWPGAVDHDAFLDDLCERYDLGKSGT